MLKLKQGCRVPFAESLSEGYELSENKIVANVDADKILPLMREFIRSHDEPVFFFLELPTRKDEETEADVTHRDVYYLDGLTGEEACALLGENGELLAQDGLCTFGFGGHFSGDELISEKYNVICLYSQNAAEQTALFERLSVPKTEYLLTAWDLFGPSAYGESARITVGGRTVFDLPALYKGRGMYFAERRED